MFDSDTSLQSSITDQKVVSKLQLKKTMSPLLVISYSKSSQLFLIFFLGGGMLGSSSIYSVFYLFSASPFLFSTPLLPYSCDTVDFIGTCSCFDYHSYL